jgi:hypothetical protein
VRLKKPDNKARQIQTGKQGRKPKWLLLQKTGGTKVIVLMVFVARHAEEVSMDHLMQQSHLQLCCSAGLENGFR